MVDSSLDLNGRLTSDAGARSFLSLDVRLIPMLPMTRFLLQRELHYQIYWPDNFIDQ